MEKETVDIGDDKAHSISDRSSTVSFDPNNDPDEDHVQRTVTSIGGISVDTQDSAAYVNAPFCSGNIKFTGITHEEEVELKKHYVCVPWETMPCELTYFMGQYWNMRSPKIILSIISSTLYVTNGKYSRLKDQFKKGIIKAANTTEMWIVTDGLNDGVADMVGEAVREERDLRAKSRLNLSQIRPDLVKKFHKLTVIGIQQKHKLVYGNRLDGSDSVTVTVTNEGCKHERDKHELNPDHSHFILVETEDDQVGNESETDSRDTTSNHFKTEVADVDKHRSQYMEFRTRFEKQLQCQTGKPRRFRRLISFGSDDDDEGEIIEAPTQTIPVVGLVIQGSPRAIDLVSFYLNNKMPVVVVKGTGGCAELLAFAVEETQDRSDPEDEEQHLKLELLKLIGQTFPYEFKDNDFARNAFRDKIMECISLMSQDNNTYLTIVNTQGYGGNLADLDKHLLKALFKSEKTSKSRQGRERAYKDLLLLLDWNRPDLAQSEIFDSQDYSRIKIDKTLFEKSLLRNHREEFVSLFLDHGFQIHKYLNHKHLKYLFEKADDLEFFSTVCLQGILGKNIMVPDQALPRDFLENDLNKLIAKLSGIKNFVQPYELSMNSKELYVLDPAVAERKAINCLIIWAVLIYRPKLAMVLWERCDDPIPVALICSQMYRELSKFPMELDQRSEMEECITEFGKMALGVLDISYRDASAQAYAMLSRPLPDFNNKTTIDIAYDANYLKFIAHSCCQKWLTKKLYGSIQLKDLDWGIFRVPYWFKILSSAWLFFPMFFWIVFGKSSSKKNKGLTVNESVMMEDELSDPSSSDEETDLLLSQTKLNRTRSSMRRRKSVIRFTRRGVKPKKEINIPIWKQMHLLWSAPITKFWMTQMFYFIYLGLFCIAVLWPTCGNFYIDTVVWLWTCVIQTELIRQTYLKHQRHKDRSMLWNCVEITFITIFLVMYLFLRIVPYWISYSDVFVTKSILSMGLIFFFYRLPHTYLPISPTLGPMLIKMNRMIKVDFVAFIRMFLIFMVSGGVTIQAILYPNYPLGGELIKRVLTRPLFAMFLTQIHDLDGDPQCSHYYANMTESYCTDYAFDFSGSHMYKPDPGTAGIQKCPHSSFGGYVITIQYLLICKLVLVTLLFALFSLTIGKVDKEATVIWKFQRYMLIMDFEMKLCFPPPLTIISYFIILLQYIHKNLTGCKHRCESFCTCTKQKKDEEMIHKIQKLKRAEDCNYWKKCSHEYVTIQEEQSELESIPKVQAQVLQTVQDDMKFQKKTMKRMTDRIGALERMIQTSRIYLEDISHKLDKNDVLGVSTVKGELVHIVARQSPYPGTSVPRCPVLDKYVPWEVQYDIYDPKNYTKPRPMFNEDEIHYVDEDIFEIRLQQQERELLTEDEIAELPPLPKVNIVWNKMVTQKFESGKQIVDRRSWILIDNTICRYKIDPLGLPLNPMGRTGLTGKGVLWRWAPNHKILAVCTRWRRTTPTDGQSSGYLYVEGKRVLEFIAVKQDIDDSCFGLPGGSLHGMVSRYSTLVESFARDVLGQSSFDAKASLDQGDLIQYFSQFATSDLGSTSNVAASSQGNLPFKPMSTSQPCLRSLSHPCLVTNLKSLGNSNTSLKTEVEELSGFSATMLYRGYIDDPRNTDNAWVEAEVWNFHYDLGDIFDVKLPDDPTKVTWKEISPNVKIFGNEGVIVQEAAKIQDAYY